APPPTVAEIPPLPPVEPKTQGLSADIANILQKIKLPERRSAPAPQAVSAPQAPAFGALPQFEGPPKGPVSSAELAAVVTPQTPPAGEAPQAPAIKSLHTMKNDLQDVVQESKISIVRAAAMEQDRKDKPEPITLPGPTPAPRGKLVGIVFGVLVLLALGG